MQSSCSSMANYQFFEEQFNKFDLIPDPELFYKYDSYCQSYYSLTNPPEIKRKCKQKNNCQRKPLVLRISRQITQPDSQQCEKQKVRIKRVRDRKQRESSLKQHKINSNKGFQLYKTSPTFASSELIVEKNPSELDHEDIKVEQMIDQMVRDETSMQVVDLCDQFEQMQIREEYSNPEIPQSEQIVESGSRQNEESDQKRQNSNF